MAEQDLQKQTEDLAKKVGTEQTKVTPITQQVQENELLGTEGKTVSETQAPTLTAQTIDPSDVQKTAKSQPTENLGQVTTPVATALPTLESQTFAGATTDFSASDLIDLDDISDATLSPGATVIPAQD